ncbi:hypothetical protein ACRAWD_21960 [Caulobacter segnis]
MDVCGSAFAGSGYNTSDPVWKSVGPGSILRSADRTKTIRVMDLHFDGTYTNIVGDWRDGVAPVPGDVMTANICRRLLIDSPILVGTQGVYTEQLGHLCHIADQWIGGG